MKTAVILITLSAVSSLLMAQKFTELPLELQAKVEKAAQAPHPCMGAPAAATAIASNVGR